MVTPSGFYLLNTITNFLFPHDPAVISLTNLTPNMYKFFTNGVAIIGTDNYKHL